MNGSLTLPAQPTPSKPVNFLFAMSDSKSETAVLTQNLLASLGELKASVAGLDDHTGATRAAADRWSIVENIEHLELLERRMLPMVQTRLTESAPPVEVTPEQLSAILDRVAAREERFNAPEAIHPAGKYSNCQQAIEGFTAARHDLIAFLETQPVLRGRYLSHPVVGPIDGYQWVLLNAAHTRRHILQIEEIKKHLPAS
jgi:hypothetical protein